MTKEQLIIAGPCAAENAEQVVESAKVISQLSVPQGTTKELRISLFKPRTNPGWDGVGLAGIAWMIEQSHLLPVATEVLSDQHPRQVVEQILAQNSHARIRIWVGARNYNHGVQQAVGRIAAEFPNNVTAMLKNPMHPDEKAWNGGAEHILLAGMPHENLVLCHRGHTPNGHPNPLKLRNLPDHDLAMRIKEKSGLRMVFDPSHTGGTLELVYLMLRTARKYQYDGLCIEAHPNPTEAKTDALQQIPLNELKSVLYNNWWTK